MRCHICDRALSDTGIVYNKTIGGYEPCPVCLEAALDAAYSKGFSPDEEPLDDPELQEEYGNGSVETVDPDFEEEWEPDGLHPWEVGYE